MPTTINEVLILIIFLIPGFVSTRLLGFSIPSRIRETSHLLLDCLAASCINYALLSPLVWFFTRQGFSSTHPVWTGIGWFVILFAFPILLAILAIRLMETPRAKWLRRALRFAHPMPKAWDYFFRQERQCWVLATLKDGRVVAGLYSTGSFASSFPNEEDLYLEKLCTLSPDGIITGVVEGSRGAILVKSDVLLLEFYDL